MDISFSNLYSKTALRSDALTSHSFELRCPFSIKDNLAPRKTSYYHLYFCWKDITVGWESTDRIVTLRCIKWQEE
ncbi:Uncharacterized protein APZ42_013438 [Daphnia magna]|uniref:Uncharacterized protein n=1 Tax=Daphnia magna TaxID=35525 RepID=A0A162QVN7_9CRUS|nr:Uncharacterized protein APZ42_013438 [Daphnia magna]